MKRLRYFFVVAVCTMFLGCFCQGHSVRAEMPYYNLQPKSLCIRSEFSTDYQTSSKERQENIALAAKAIDKTLIDVNAEFSFNQKTGERSERTGYKQAKIIFNGKFIDGVGGGVCQVSTTLYNAVLLAGLKITEYHPHSLPVSYVKPSFDAMVNSYSADFRFVNNTNNPIIIRAKADGKNLKITIIGEPSEYQYIRESEIIEYIDVTEEEIIKDEKSEYPSLKIGEKVVISYGKKGYKSRGYLIKKKGNKVISKKLIRQDKYNATKKIIIEGTGVHLLNNE